MSNTNKRAELRAQQAKAAEAARRKKMILVGVGIAVAAALIIGIVVLVNVLGKSAGSKEGYPAGVTDTLGFPMNSEPKSGAKNVQLLTDYQCPACKSFEDKFGPEIDALAKSGDIKLSIQTLTFLDNSLGNDSSQRAAEAAACSADAGAFPAYFKTVYKNQPQKEGMGFTADQLRNGFATEAGITGTKLADFQQCVDSKKYAGFVKKANEEGNRILSKTKANGTPTLVVNGKHVDLQKLDLSKPNAVADAIKATS